MIIIYIMVNVQKISLINQKKNAPVAQLDRALGYGPGGSGFKF